PAGSPRRRPVPAHLAGAGSAAHGAVPPSPDAAGGTILSGAVFMTLSPPGSRPQRRPRYARGAGAMAVVAAGGLAWGWFEAGWLRFRELELELAGLPAELDGLRVAHLSDFHLRVPSRGEQATGRAVAWAAARGP